jgi:hypothetical protein
MLLLALLVLPMLAAADTLVSSPPEVRAVRLTGTITIDGSLDDPAWKDVPPYTHFTQRDPVEGDRPSLHTEVRLAYDDAAIYVGARMDDPSPDSITVRLGRRDLLQNTDVFGIFLDPYHDRRSGFYFGLDPAGTILDGILYNDDWSDASWDGVWEGTVHRDAYGWSAEMRIPFSQLRFQAQEVSCWGINLRRDIARRNESDLVVFTPKNGSGYVSRFVDLVGIRDITPPDRFEVLPYVTMRAAYLQHASGDPFKRGSEYKPRAGADVKIGLGSNLTLDGAVNPDFGQVEVDPAVVNLSDVESYFSEKRPFFIEGASIFNFGRGGVTNYWGFNWSTPEFFYTRRIGRSPQGSIPDADYSSVPPGTDILGAAKLTGKIGGAWNVGTVQAVTSREFANLQRVGVRSSAEVEPAAYYGVIRAQREFNEGNQAIGIISATTSRLFSDPRLRDELNSGSTVAGLDGWTFLDSSKAWVISGWGAASLVKGDQARLTALQSNPQHYLQRPDAGGYRIDSAATSMSGYAGRVTLARQRGDFFFNAALGVINPRFDNNDLGFLGRADVINCHAVAGNQWTNPTDWFRRLELGGALFRSMDFDRNIVWEGVFGFGTLQLLNNYTFRLDGAYNPQSVNTRRTRGGPLTLNPSGYQVDWEIQSDTRRDVVVDVNSFLYNDRETSWNINASVELHPSSNVTISIGPGFERNADFAQWVDAFDDPSATATYGKRYVFALLNQTTLSANLRVNWTFTPQLSLQLFVQPLISVGSYRDFRELKRPRSFDFVTYGTGGSAIASSGLTYTVDPDGAGLAAPFSFDNPDFNFRSLRGNAVLRWEYRPGSALYLVWTQTRSASDAQGDFRFNDSFRQLMSIRPDNIFMVKLSYWWDH